MSIAAENRGQLLDTLPPLIRQMTSQEMWDTDETGLSQAAVFCGKKMVLKIEKENSTADQEYHMLSWLQGKLPVPRLLAFERKDGRNYLLMERLSGEMACADSYMEDPARQAEVLSNGLRLLWSTDISGCRKKEELPKEALDYWCPVDWYNGGMEHTTLHLLYSRFWHKFLYDLGLVSNPEPYAKRTSHGMILGENGEKMSKSRGNVVNPDDIVKEYGADTMRLYEMFIGDFEKSAPWSTSSIKGCKRFLDRVWALQDILTEGDNYSEQLESAFHKAIKKVGEDIEEMKFNTAIATLMALINDISDHKSVNHAELKTFLILLNPFAPHITEEIWEAQNFGGMLNQQSWPSYDEAKCVDATVEIAVQISGKIKSRINVPTDATKEQLLELAKADSIIASILEGKTIVKEIVVPGKLVNIVAK